MKRYLKWCAAALSIVLMFSLAGCKEDKPSLPQSDDKIALSYGSDSEYKVSKSGNQIVVKKEDREIMVATFVSEEGLQQYIAENESTFKVLEFGVTRGLRYVDCEQKVGDAVEYVRFGWVMGSNTGIVFDGTANRVDMSVAIKDVVINYETSQDDPLYYSYVVDDFIAKNPSQLERIDYGFYQNFQVVTPKETLSKDWKDGEFKLDGIVYEFPVSYKLLRQNGWLIDRSIKTGPDAGHHVGVYLEPGEEYSTEMHLVHQDYGDDWKDDGKTWHIDAIFKNTSNEKKILEDCEITWIYINVEHSDRFSGNPVIELANGVKWEMTMQDVVNAIGKPSKREPGASYTVLTYKNDKNPEAKLTLVLGNRTGLVGVAFGSSSNGYVDH